MAGRRTLNIIILIVSMLWILGTSFENNGGEEKTVVSVNCKIPNINTGMSKNISSGLTESSIYEYQKYIWKIEISMVKYDIDRTEYEIRNTTIPNFTSGIISPLVGEFKDGKLKSYHGISNSYYGNRYYQYYDFGDFIYMSILSEIINAPLFYTPEYFLANPSGYENLKRKLGNKIQMYDPILTIYNKEELLLINGKHFILDRNKKELIQLYMDTYDPQCSTYNEEDDKQIAKLQEFEYMDNLKAIVMNTP